MAPEDGAKAHRLMEGAGKDRFHPGPHVWSDEEGGWDVVHVGQQRETRMCSSVEVAAGRSLGGSVEVS